MQTDSAGHVGNGNVGFIQPPYGHDLSRDGQVVVYSSTSDNARLIVYKSPSFPSAARDTLPVVDSPGDVTFTAPSIPPGSYRGQWMVIDPGAPGGMARSHAMRFDVLP